MALTQEDLKELGTFIDARVTQAVSAAAEDAQAREQTPQERSSVVGKPDVDPESGPLHWVHLANGDVVETFDAGSTHLPGADGEPVLVIGRYQKGE